MSAKVSKFSASLEIAHNTLASGSISKLLAGHARCSSIRPRADTCWFVGKTFAPPPMSRLMKLSVRRRCVASSTRKNYLLRYVRKNSTPNQTGPLPRNKPRGLENDYFYDSRSFRGEGRKWRALKTIASPLRAALCEWWVSPISRFGLGSRFTDDRNGALPPHSRRRRRDARSRLRCSKKHGQVRCSTKNTCI